MLTPNVRLARHLRWRAGIVNRRSGTSAWHTPDIVTLPQWLERCWEESLVTGGSAGQKLLLTDAQFRHVSRGIIEEISGNGLPGTGIERLIRQSRSTCASWRISTHDLRAAVTGPDTEFFADWAERFQAICSEQGWVDTPGLPELLLPELETLLAKNQNPIVIAGIDHPTASEVRLFGQLDQSGKLMGSLAPASPVERKTGQLRFDEPTKERRAAAIWARAQLEKRPDALIGIVVPNLSTVAGAYRRDFLDAFDPKWRERDNVLYPVSVVDGERLSATGIVRTALLLLRVPGGKLEFNELGWLLRSPFAGGWEREIDARARFDLRIRQDGLQTINLRTLRKRFCQPGHPGPETFLELIEAVLEIADTTRGFHEPAAWAGIIDSLLKAANFCQGRNMTRRDDLTLRQWERLLDGFAAMGEVTGRIGFRQAIALITEAARDQPSGENHRDDGVQIVTPAEAGYIHFDAVWLSGMTSAAWPGDARPSPLIPMSLQRDRGIPDALPDLYRARSLKLWQSLVENSAQCIASWSAQEGEETLLPSPLIAAMTPLQPSQLGIDRQLGSLYSPSTPMALTETSNDCPPPVTSNEIIRGGSRLLTLQSVCPSRAFFELRLGAKEMPIPPFALDALTRGSLVHDAAEFFYDELGRRPAAASNDQIEAAVTSAIHRALDRRVPPMHPLCETLRETEKPRLERLLLNLIDYDRTRGPIDVPHVEQQRKLIIGGVELHVRFDRIDADKEGGTLVIDYKTGGKFGVNHWLGDRPLEMQMPLYAAYGEFDGIVLYWMHASGLTVTGMSDRDWGIGRNRSFRILSSDAWREQLEAWRATCERLIAEYRDGDCRIDLERDGPATGDYAMLTRRWMLRTDSAQGPA